MKRPLVCGNWKMYRTPREARALAADIAQGLRGHEVRAEVAVCPAFPAISAVAETLRETSVAWGAQNCAASAEGAFTGEVSAGMLVDLGCRFVIVGHSERRRIFGETDDMVREKLEAVLRSGMTPIVCCGETLEEREAARTEEVVERQIRAAFAGFPKVGLPGAGAGSGSQPEAVVSVDAEAPVEAMASAVVAYEPVWAIGTGRNATPDIAEAVHRKIRVVLAALLSEPVAVATRILYGGSLKAENAREIFSQPNVDGGLVGGASLEAKSFVSIVGAA